jgi:uncharacterized repeat protein (TIGR03806 family)
VEYSFNFPISGPGPAPMSAVVAFEQLAFSRPVFATHAPDGTDRIFALEQSGRILVFPNDPSSASAAVFLDIRSRVTASSGEEGLLGLAFDPAYTVNGLFYVHYTRATPHQSVIAQYRVSTDPDAADPASEEVLLALGQPFGNHNSGMIAFGPDDMLYVGFGDGGSGGDPLAHGQDLTTLHGSMLRIDPHGDSPYGIPADNPFVGGGLGVREEIWAYGLRNPWRFSFDRQTGDLWLGDVGQGEREEVDIIAKGGNYGWNVYEGTTAFRNPQNLSATDFTQPVHDYPRSQGRAVVGGYVYRGTRLPELRGAYVYGDYTSGTIWALVRDGGAVSTTAIATVPNISSFGEDRDGELLLVSHGGRIHRLEPSAGDRALFPQRLSETGLFQDLEVLIPAAGLHEYEVNSPLWSDGAHKRRWLATPRGPMGFDPTEAWSFPVGSVLVKHFELETSVGDPTSRRRLETRVLLHEDGGWAGYTYKWNDEQTDAELLGGRLVETYLITDPFATGGQRQQTWTYPSRTDCLQCHTPAAGQILGVRTRQLNLALGAENQIDRMLDLGVLTGATPGASYESYPDPADGTRTHADRARSYLAVNCAVCHLPSGPAPTGIDLTWGVPENSMGLIGVRPSHGDLGLGDPWLVRRGSKETSVLWERMRRLDGDRMPTVGSHEVDAVGVEVVGAWIDTLK